MRSEKLLMRLPFLYNAALFSLSAMLVYGVIISIEAVFMVDLAGEAWALAGGLITKLLDLAAETLGIYKMQVKASIDPGSPTD